MNSPSTTLGQGEAITIVSGEFVAVLSFADPESIDLELRIARDSKGYTVIMTQIRGEFPHLRFKDEDAQPNRNAAIARAWYLYQKELEGRGCEILRVNPSTLPDSIEVLKRLVMVMQGKADNLSAYLEHLISS